MARSAAQRWGVAVVTIAIAMLLGALVPDSAAPRKKRLARSPAAFKTACDAGETKYCGR